MPKTNANIDHCSVCSKNDDYLIVGGAGYTICRMCFCDLMSRQPAGEHKRCKLCGRSIEIIAIDQRIGICSEDVQHCLISFDLPVGQFE